MISNVSFVAFFTGIVGFANVVGQKPIMFLKEWIAFDLIRFDSTVCEHSKRGTQDFCIGAHPFLSNKLVVGM